MMMTRCHYAGVTRVLATLFTMYIFQPSLEVSATLLAARPPGHRTLHQSSGVFVRSADQRPEETRDDDDNSFAKDASEEEANWRTATGDWMAAPRGCNASKLQYLRVSE